MTVRVGEDLREQTAWRVASSDTYRRPTLVQVLSWFDVAAPGY